MEGGRNRFLLCVGRASLVVADAPQRTAASVFPTLTESAGNSLFGATGFKLPADPEAGSHGAILFERFSRAYRCVGFGGQRSGRRRRSVSRKRRAIRAARPRRGSGFRGRFSTPTDIIRVRRELGITHSHLHPEQMRWQSTPEGGGGVADERRDRGESRAP